MIAPSSCIVCGQTRWAALPDPGPYSMASDLRVVAEPMARFSCLNCGLGARQPSGTSGGALYTSGYGLYAHAPGNPREAGRQSHYARWIVAHMPSPPRRVLDVGCGNGSLLRALRTYWPEAELLGCDPSAESVACGSGDGIRLWHGTADDLPSDLRVDLVVSVNVIEHTEDPAGFVATLSRRLDEDGVLVVVSPDGSVAGVESLFVDHLFSLSLAHVEALLARHGLVMTAAPPFPALGAFQMAIAQRGRPNETKLAAGEAVTAMRRQYLERWRGLDSALCARIGGEAVCFGAGEAAGLLRAYAPSTWSHVRACTFDDAIGGAFGQVPVVPLSAVASNDTIVVGVRPADQPAVAGALRRRFGRVITWYDLVDE